MIMSMKSSAKNYTNIFGRNYIFNPMPVNSEIQFILSSPYAVVIEIVYHIFQLFTMYDLHIFPKLLFCDVTYYIGNRPYFSAKEISGTCSPLANGSFSPLPSSRGRGMTGEMKQFNQCGMEETEPLITLTG